MKMFSYLAALFLFLSVFGTSISFGSGAMVGSVPFSEGILLISDTYRVDWEVPPSDEEQAKDRALQQKALENYAAVFQSWLKKSGIPVASYSDAKVEVSIGNEERKAAIELKEPIAVQFQLCQAKPDAYSLSATLAVRVLPSTADWKKWQESFCRFASVKPPEASASLLEKLRSAYHQLSAPTELKHDSSDSFARKLSFPQLVQRTFAELKKSGIAVVDEMKNPRNRGYFEPSEQNEKLWLSFERDLKKLASYLKSKNVSEVHLRDMTKTGRPLFEGKSLKVGIFEFLSGADIIDTFSKREPHTHYPLMSDSESRLDLYAGQGARLRDQADQRLLLTYVGIDVKTPETYTVEFQKESEALQPIGPRSVLSIGPNRDGEFQNFRVHFESFDARESMITLNVTVDSKQPTSSATKTSPVGSIPPAAPLPPAAPTSAVAPAVDPLRTKEMETLSASFLKSGIQLRWYENYLEEMSSVSFNSIAKLLRAELPKLHSELEKAGFASITICNVTGTDSSPVDALLAWDDLEKSGSAVSLIREMAKKQTPHQIDAGRASLAFSDHGLRLAWAILDKHASSKISSDDVTAVARILKSESQAITEKIKGSSIKSFTVSDITGPDIDPQFVSIDWRAVRKNKSALGEVQLALKAIKKNGR